MSWPKFWNKLQWQSIALMPLSKLVCWEAKRRLHNFRQAQQVSTARQTTATVIVVGNVVVGGTGKTPFIIWLSKKLQQQGLKVGIISRGYGVKAKQQAIWVTKESQASECGDEPVMLAKQTGCPVAVSPQRDQALQLLNEQANCDVVISDDGLQHYALQRDIEIVLIDAERQFGNQLCLPAGPLREPLSRIAEVDYTIWNGLNEQQAIPELAYQQKSAHKMQLSPACFRQVGQPDNSVTPAEFIEKYPQKTALAIAGIGNPARFFNTLQTLGIEADGQTFADHHAYSKQELIQLVNSSNQAIQQKPLIMTEKDAVKCTEFAESEPDWWYLQVETLCDDSIIDEIIARHNSRSAE